MPISQKFNYETRNNKSVQIFTTSARGSFPVYGVINLDDEDLPAQWSLEGVYSKATPGEEHRYDLLELKQKASGYINCYPDKYIFFPTRLKADENAAPNRIACIPFSFVFRSNEGL